MVQLERNLVVGRGRERDVQPVKKMRTATKVINLHLLALVIGKI